MSSTQWLAPGKLLDICRNREFKILFVVLLEALKTNTTDSLPPLQLLDSSSSQACAIQLTWSLAKSPNACQKLPITLRYRRLPSPGRTQKDASSVKLQQRLLIQLSLVIIVNAIKKRLDVCSTAFNPFSLVL